MVGLKGETSLSLPTAVFLLGLENRDYGRRGSAADYATPLFPQKLALTSLTSGDRLVGIVRSQTKDTELLYSSPTPPVAYVNQPTVNVAGAEYVEVH
jgi:hypothetical protein